MGAIACLVGEQPPPALAAELAPLMQALADWGPDGDGVQTAVGCALGVHAFFATPEEDADRQPLRCEATGDLVALDGRLDNRDELAAALAIRATGMSDARLILHAFRRWGDAGLARLDGDVAVCVYQVARRRLLAYRDPLGGRPLYYAHAPAGLAVASSPHALICGASDLDLGRVASYLALTPPSPSATFFTGVSELRPGHVLIANERGIATRQLAAIEPRSPPCPASEYPAYVRALLDRSVRARTRVRGRVAVSLSSGLDSSAVAALAVRAGAAPMHVSWTFPTLAGADEGPHIASLARALALPGRLVACDDCAPLGLADDLLDPGDPNVNLYRALKDRVYAAAGAAGARTILTGFGADELACAQPAWLAAALARARPRRAAQLLGEQLDQTGATPATLRIVARAAGARRPLWLRDRRRPPWLTPLGWQLASAAARESRDVRWPWLVGPWTTKALGTEAVWRHKRRFDLRHPFRDRRLIESVLGLPADAVQSPAQPKRLLRDALRPVLPPEIVAAPRRGTLYELYARGARQHGDAIRDLLAASSDELRALSDARWLGRAWPGQLASEREEVSLWHCASFERWQRQLRGM